MTDYANLTSKQELKLAKLENKYAYRQQVADIKAKYAPPSVFMNPYVMQNPYMANPAQSDPGMQMQNMMQQMMQFMVMKMMFEQMGMSFGGEKSEGGVNTQGMASGNGKVTGTTGEKGEKITEKQFDDGSSEKIVVDSKNNTKTHTINRGEAIFVRNEQKSSAAAQDSDHVEYTYKNGNQTPAEIKVGEGDAAQTFSYTKKKGTVNDVKNLPIYEKTVNGKKQYFVYTKDDNTILRLTQDQEKSLGLIK